MDKRYMTALVGGALLLLSTASCNLQRDPLSDFSDVTVPEPEKSDSIKYTTREQMVQQYEAFYNSVRNGQEKWYVDMIVYGDIHADNAYRGGSEGELYTLEKHSQDGMNLNVRRDWNWFMSAITAANRVIVNIDAVPDPSLTATERKQWKAEAMIYRAWLWFDMSRLWGEIPLITEEVPDITAENIDELAPLLFPSRQSIEVVYNQIIGDLTAAAVDAPNLDNSNKYYFTKPVAKALLAKIYAEKPMRDYTKTIQYCNEVATYGFQLVSNYRVLYGWDNENKVPSARSTVESIFEIVYPAGTTNWTPMMFGLVYNNPNSVYDWAKWVTPSRDLIRAFEEEGDQIRYSESIVWGQPSWSQHYPSNNYPFMYKNRSEFNSLIKLRYADILLLKAEALVATGALSEAAALVNQVRARVNLSALESSVTSNPEAMKMAVLNERRLELAFEGERFFDLVRNDKALEVLNSLNSRDEGRIPQMRITQERLLLPIPITEIENNGNLKQNPGY